MAQAIFRSLAGAAARGEARAQAMFLKLVSASEREAAMVEEMIDEAREEDAQQPVKIVYESTPSMVVRREEGNLRSRRFQSKW
jgi:hypothetical protein